VPKLRKPATGIEGPKGSGVENDASQPADSSEPVIRYFETHLTEKVMKHSETQFSLIDTKPEGRIVSAILTGGYNPSASWGLATV